MVSIHDTSKFHNYINSPPPLPEFQVIPNTILDFLQRNHPNQFELIRSSKLLTNALNNSQLKYTLFLPMEYENVDSEKYVYRKSMGYDDIDFERYVYRGSVDMSTDFQVTSINGYIIKKSKNQVNTSDILVKEINLINGTIHIIKNKF